MKIMWSAIATAAIVTLAVAAYWVDRRPSELAMAFAARVDENSARLVSLSELTSFPWEAVVFLGPYTSRETARSAMGFEWKDFETFDLEMSDSFSLAVFLKGNQVIKASKINRCRPDFGGELLAKQIPPSAAQFVIDRSSGCATFRAANQVVPKIATSEQAHAF